MLNNTYIVCIWYNEAYSNILCVTYTYMRNEFNPLSKEQQGKCNFKQIFAVGALATSMLLAGCTNGQTLIPTSEPPAPTDMVPFSETEGLEIGLNTQDLCLQIPPSLQSGPVELVLDMNQILPNGDAFELNSDKVIVKRNGDSIPNTPDPKNTVKIVGLSCETKLQDIQINPMPATCDMPSNVNQSYAISLGLLAQDMAYAIDHVAYSINGRSVVNNMLENSRKGSNTTFEDIKGLKNRSAMLNTPTQRINLIGKNGKKANSLVVEYRCVTK